MATLGLLGFGTIGKYIYNELSRENHTFSFVYDRQNPSPKELKNTSIKYITKKEELNSSLLSKTDYVIECATSDLVKDLAPIILCQSNLFIFSLTSLSDSLFFSHITNVAQNNSTKIFIPHGAILGLDGILDGSSIIETVNITTTKKPNNLGLINTTREIVYTGPTRNACSLYPRNVNVHAAVALAGIGFDKTISTIISDPQSRGNLHEIEVKSNGCYYKIEICSTPSDGVTGSYTPISAVASIKKVIDLSTICIV